MIPHPKGDLGLNISLGIKQKTEGQRWALVGRLGEVTSLRTVLRGTGDTFGQVSWGGAHCSN